MWNLRKATYCDHPRHIFPYKCRIKRAKKPQMGLTLSLKISCIVFYREKRVLFSKLTLKGLKIDFWMKDPRI